MKQNTSVNITEKDKLDLELIQKENTGSTIGVLACIVRSISANQSRQIIFQKAKGIQSSNTLQPAQLATFSSFLSLLTSIILGNVAFVRLKELEDSIKSGTSKLSITPDVNISTGYSLDVLGNFIKLLGRLQKLNE